jgi:hypothetical protein
MRIQVSRESGYGLLLEEGPLAGEYYRLNPLICTNPVCECKVISLHGFSRARDLPQPFAPTDICLEMDLAKRVVTNLKSLEADSTGYAFAKAVASEISDGDWAELWNIYLLVKQKQTEQADLDSLDIQFPPEVLAGDGWMVSYNEILPFAPRVVFPVGVDQWFFDDQYCVNPTCSCWEAAISFFLVRPSPPREPLPIDPDLTFFYAYEKGQITTREVANASGRSGHHLLKALKDSRPDLDSFLAQRHRVLRRLFRRASGETTRRLAIKMPGRNDPCTCGSGKKYKRCCGAA